MVGIIIKSDERRAAEARPLQEFGISSGNATGEQRDYAECVTLGERVMKREFERMEEKSR